MMPHARTHDVLLVEDSPADVFLVKNALKGKLSIEVAVDAADALRALRSGAVRPAIVLLDLNLPGVDGREVLAQLKADPELSGIPVVVLTSSDAEADRQLCYARGAAGYVVKRVDVDAFDRALDVVRRYWFEAGSV